MDAVQPPQAFDLGGDPGGRRTPAEQLRGDRPRVRVRRHMHRCRCSRHGPPPSRCHDVGPDALSSQIPWGVGGQRRAARTCRPGTDRLRRGTGDARGCAPPDPRRPNVIVGLSPPAAPAGCRAAEPAAARGSRPAPPAPRRRAARPPGGPSPPARPAAPRRPGSARPGAGSAPWAPASRRCPPGSPRPATRRGPGRSSSASTAGSSADADGSRARPVQPRHRPTQPGLERGRELRLRRSQLGRQLAPVRATGSASTSRSRDTPSSHAVSSSPTSTTRSASASRSGAHRAGRPRRAPRTGRRAPATSA